MGFGLHEGLTTCGPLFWGPHVYVYPIVYKRNIGQYNLDNRQKAETMEAAKTALILGLLLETIIVLAPAFWYVKHPTKTGTKNNVASFMLWLLPGWLVIGALHNLAIGDEFYYIAGIFLILHASLYGVVRYLEYVVESFNRLLLKTVPEASLRQIEQKS